MNITTVGIDLAKNVFSVHGVDAHGKTVLKKTVSRNKLLELFAHLPPCVIGMEAICEAVSRPAMRFAPVKSVEQQAVLSLHRIRSAVVAERTAQINQIRGLLSEFGLIMSKGRYPAQHHLPDILEDAENGLPGLARRLLYDIYQRIQTLNQQILAYDREIEALARHSEAAKRLMSLPGIGAESRPLLSNWGNRDGMIPYTVIFDKSGRVTHARMGIFTEEVFDDLVRPLL